MAFEHQVRQLRVGWHHVSLRYASILEYVAKRVELLTIVALTAQIPRLLIVLYFFLYLVLKTQNLNVKLCEHEAAALEQRFEAQKQVPNELHRQLHYVFEHEVQRRVVEEFVGEHNALKEVKQAVGYQRVGLRVIDYLRHQEVVGHIKQRKLIGIQHRAIIAGGEVLLQILLAVFPDGVDQESDISLLVLLNIRS